MLLTIALVVLIALSLALTLYVRPADLPTPAPESPYRHLDERKARIYENLRDLQFEYLLGKLSDEDYKDAKLVLQKELAQVLASTEAMKASLGQPAAPVVKLDPLVCVHCKARMPKLMKFCGECGKEMAK
jgi:hypothetical protein